MSIQIINHLLQQVDLISKKHEQIEELTGENFNIFDILGVRSDELSHSSFVSYLLSAKGKHGQKDLFLKLFITQLETKFKYEKADVLNKFQTERSQAITEMSLGNKSSDVSNGGRIDIIIKDGTYNIIIENKIYAPDQEKQLVRYHNHDRNAPLIYLTLGDEMPSKDSISHEEKEIELKEGIDFISISYRNDIKNWIEECIKAVYDKPLIRETLRQYIFLINELTNQSNNKIMSKEIRSLITKDNAGYIKMLNDELNGIISELRTKIFNSFILNDIKLKDDSIIKITFSEDGDGVFIGYSIYKNEKNISSVQYSKSLISKFKESNPDLLIHSSNSYFAWYTPIKYKKGQRLFSDNNYEEILGLYNSIDLLKEFINKIVEEEKSIRNNFLKMIINNLQTNN
jgi:hypothetical protein